MIVQATQIEKDTVATGDQPEYGRKLSFPCTNAEPETTNKFTSDSINKYYQD